MPPVLIVQIGLGIESWLARFDVGFAASLWKPVTVRDALLRSAHAVVGYTLFAATVALAWQTRRPADISRSVPINAAVLEVVA